MSLLDDDTAVLVVGESSHGRVWTGGVVLGAPGFDNDLGVDGSANSLTLSI
jgi:hypothetical protein